MRVVAKIERMKGEDFYNDDWNIADMEEKEEISENMKALIEDLNNSKTVNHQVRLNQTRNCSNTD